MTEQTYTAQAHGGHVGADHNYREGDGHDHSVEMRKPPGSGPSGFSP